MFMFGTRNAQMSVDKMSKSEELQVAKAQGKIDVIRVGQQHIQGIHHALFITIPMA